MAPCGDPSAFTIVLGVPCVGMLGVATNIATAALPDMVQMNAWIAWPLVGIALLAMAAIELRRGAGGLEWAGWRTCRIDCRVGWRS